MKLYDELLEESLLLDEIDTDVMCNVINCELLKISKKERKNHGVNILALIIYHNNLTKKKKMYEYSENRAIATTTFKIRNLPHELILIIYCYTRKISKSSE